MALEGYCPLVFLNLKLIEKLYHIHIGILYGIYEKTLKFRASIRSPVTKPLQPGTGPQFE